MSRNGARVKRGALASPSPAEAPVTTTARFEVSLMRCCSTPRQACPVSLASRRRRAHPPARAGNGAETPRRPRPSARHSRRFDRRFCSHRRRAAAGATRPSRPRRQGQDRAPRQRRGLSRQRPTPRRASSSQGKNSPGSRSCGRARCRNARARARDGIAWRRQMSLASAAVASIWRRRKGARVVMAGMDDLDADRGGVHVGLAGPEA